MKNIILSALLVSLTVGVTAQSPLLNEFIGNYARDHNFNGTILIRNNSGIIYQRSFGLANIPFRIPNNTNTRYKIASITKAFTSVLILQLYEQRKLDLDQTISTYLPDYTGSGGNRVTIANLLNMTSGLHNMDEGATLENVLKNGIPQYQRPYTTDDLLVKYCSDSLVTEPGKEFDYNNANYIILGKIIERISCKSFEENLAEKILKPLQMESSGMLSQQKIVDDLADTYFFRDDLNRMVNDLPVYIENWYAAGAMYSTVYDILKFSDALFGGKLLKQETLNRMFVSGPGEYGLGFWVHNDYEINHRKYTVIKRPGAIMGAQAMLFHVLENGTTIIILSNTATLNMDEFAADIAKNTVI